MVDKIANHVSNLEVRSNKNTSKSSKIDASLNADTVNNVSSSINSNKKIVNE